MNEIQPGIPAHLLSETSDLPKAKNAMGKDEFMKLLLVQLKHQDPMKPMDHQEFTAQLAQFSQLEQLANIGKGIDTLQQGTGSDAKLQAMSMIGKRVQGTGNEVQLMEGQAVSLAHNLPADFKPARASVYSPEGKLVRDMQINPAKEGSSEVVWDGKSDDGVNLPSGKYSFRVNGVGPNGQSLEGGAGLSGLVTGVEVDGHNAQLIVQTASGKTKVGLDKIKEVGLDTAPVEAKKPPALPAGLQEKLLQAAEASEASDEGESDSESDDSMFGDRYSRGADIASSNPWRGR